MSKSQMEHLVKKHQWSKIENRLSSADVPSRLALAAALGDSGSSTLDDGAVTALIWLLDDSDDGVLLQAVKSLGAVGNESAKTHLQSLLNRLPSDKDALNGAIKESIVLINEHIKELTKV